MNHEKSKMHKQAVKALQKEVMSKDELIEEGEKAAEEPIPENEPKKKKNKKKKKKNQQIDDGLDDLKEEVE